MKLKKIFLDLDGPILEGKNRHYKCYEQILTQHGYSPLPIEEYWKLKRARCNRLELLKYSNATSIYDEFLETWLNVIEEKNILKLDEVQHGVHQCLQEWKDQEIELLLVTLRSNHENLIEQLKNLSLFEYFDEILICKHAKGGEGKAEAVRKQGRDQNISSALWIGDTEIDWEAARELGCPVMLVSNGLRDEAYLQTLQGATVKNSISEVSNWLK